MKRTCVLLHFWHKIIVTSKCLQHPGFALHTATYERQPPEYWPVSLGALVGYPKFDLFERVRVVNHNSNIHDIMVAAKS